MPANNLASEIDQPILDVAGEKRLPDSSTTYLQWDEFCDLLGGAGWQEAYDSWERAGLSPQRRSALPQLSRHFSTSPQFLHEGSGACFPLEALWLKWNLFSTLCRKIQALHEHRRLPYLGLHPGSVRIHCIAPDGAWLPKRWLFSVEPMGSLGAVPFSNCEDMPPEMARCLCTPSGSLSPMYTPPIIREWPLGREEVVTLLLPSINRIPDDDGSQARALLRIHIISDAISGIVFSERDVFRLSFTLPGRSATSVKVWARRVDAVERGIVLSGVTDPLPSHVWEQLERAREHVFADARAAIYRAVDESCDLYGLGMLLVRALLVNHDRELQQVNESLQRLLGCLDPIVRGSDPNDHETLLLRVSPSLREAGFDVGSSTFMYHGAAGFPGQPRVPHDLWGQVVIFLLRLLSQIPDFGFSCRSSEHDSASPSALMTEVSRAAEQLGRRIRIELFGSRGRDQELVQVCDRVKGQLVRGRTS